MAMRKEHNKNVAPGCEEPRSKVVCGMVDALGRAQRLGVGRVEASGWLSQNTTNHACTYFPYTAGIALLGTGSL